MTDADEATIYIVDDDRRVRLALLALLETMGRRAQAFDSLGAFLAAPREDKPACLVLDVVLPDINGLEFQMRRNGASHPPVVMITGRGDIASSVRAMRHGAVDYLVKPFKEDDLVRAVDAAIAIDIADRARRREHDRLAGRMARLTPREREVLQFVVSGYLNKQAAAALGISEVTLQIHRSSIMRKMGARSLAELVRVADRLGVSLLPPAAGQNVARRGS